jgi:hypothetical protein
VTARRSSLTSALERAPAYVLTVYAVTAAFSAYFCMYAYRKAFAAGTFAGTVSVFGLALDRKVVLVLAQVAGYCISKFLGIKIVSELRPERRAGALVLCIGIAEAALLLLPILPNGWQWIALLLNGLPLGLVWGLVFGFLEGRKTSEILGAGLCASFIVASGAVKSVGKYLLDRGITEAWMPAVTGLLFLPPLLLCAFLLSRMPPPSADDEAQRCKRAPMDAAARLAFVKRYAPGLVLLVGLYVPLTALRDFRDNFAREIWDTLGYGSEASILTEAEAYVAAFALLTVAVMMPIRNNRIALLAVHGAMLAGVAVAAGSTLAFQAGLIGGKVWMIALGTGIYVTYVPYNCVLFDRLVAATRSVATAGFLIYVADATGYLGSSALVVYKNLGAPALPWADFLGRASLLIGLAGVGAYVASAAYFWKKTRPEEVKSPSLAELPVSGSPAP